jgi:hypothetical protein
LSFVGPKIAFRIFLSKTPKMASSDFDNTHVSEPYTSTGLIKVLYNFIFFLDKSWDLNCLFKYTIYPTIKKKEPKEHHYIATGSEHIKNSEDQPTWCVLMWFILLIVVVFCDS